ncbi:GNAT family N-acetyltransferase [Pseudomonas sp. Fl4BN1]|uniref:GNAT family N-acetyltransferase n=1 Tax=Pseudomonas sp. Fl4BN1 TaxID=2697651 RepID=UPI001377EF61|nr:GNAT family N-acetyltransferase [Pseudomonas sp. Fl4BN1]NBF08144.1 GNAT family N-acetyltransferase [Pseudomonas sp. Fl4BN1]
MSSFLIESQDYAFVDKGLQKEITSLLDDAFPSSENEQAETSETHRKELNARSFYCYMDKKLVGYAAIIQTTIKIGDEEFHVAGPTCVATSPNYCGRGIGTELVKQATIWLEKQPQIDFGMFTCKPSLVPFYSRASGWKVAPNVIVVGSLEAGALTSTSLDCAVLMRLFSKKATSLMPLPSNMTINLNFPVGEFM